jgi:hypothetical protein
VQTSDASEKVLFLLGNPSKGTVSQNFSSRLFPHKTTPYEPLINELAETFAIFEKLMAVKKSGEA